jgi:hypothetical protein
MRSLTALRVGSALALWLGPAVVVEWAWAQEAPGTAPAASDGGTGVIPLLVLFAVVVAAIIGAARLHDRRQAREAEALALQARLSDVLLADSMLAGFPITVTIHIPLLRRSPPIAEVHGQVPSPELRQTTLRVIERELSRRRPDIRIEDRMMVLPPIRAARVA